MLVKVYKGGAVKEKTRKRLDDAIAPNAMRVFRTDLEQSRRVTMDDVWNRGLADRVADSFCYWIRALL